MWQRRALELNTQDIWHWRHITALADYARRYGFNTLVLGQADLLDKLVTPPAYQHARFDDRISSQQRSRCVYLNQVAAYCREQGLALYLQCKELAFPTDLLLQHPQLLDDARQFRIDTHFWCDYLAAKVDLLMQQIPRLSGLMLAISNSDSLIRFAPPPGEEMQSGIISPTMPPAMPPTLDSEPIYRQLFTAVSRVVHAHQRHLVLRAFPANHHDMSHVLEAIRSLPVTVSAAIKMTPERFWPEFPNNPALLELDDREIWVELDLAGEEVGWGNLPFLRYTEIQGRLLWCREKNPAIVSAACRISWDGVDNHSVLGSLSEFTLFACARLLNDSAPPVNESELFRQWLAECWQWQPDDAVRHTMRALLEQAQQALSLSLYARHHVFHRHSLLPSSYGQAVWSLYGQLNRNHWLPGSGRDITFDRRETELASQNLYQIVREKDAAWQLADQSQQAASQFARDHDLPEPLRQRWQQEWRGLALYCRAFVHAQKAFFTLHYCQRVENNWTLREIAKTNIQALYGIAHEMDDFCLQHRDYPVSMHVMFDAARPRALADSLQQQLTVLTQDTGGGHQAASRHEA
ncbi:hypothetical protein MJO48_17780 [Dickeya fangzhongdai]|uniref:hypothetical protein n=1 Tax=Dickeya fangzhongdai TaxID=1778540 RepID=UPI000EAEBD38|nr:hypothetical protein [Dickeya fangzhongdai]AYH49296.1 hypothetical protein B6N31_17435 [Dickeya fangzhongdai]ULR30274.1 hypothetical protein MJO48_17780 [Dickeya fangzhongdai]UMB76005.1 hypothetical protein FXN80_18305 [Dickeya fangzhongdai]